MGNRGFQPGKLICLPNLLASYQLSSYFFSILASIFISTYSNTATDKIFFFLHPLHIFHFFWIYIIKQMSLDNFKNFLSDFNSEQVNQALQYGHRLYNLKLYDIDNIDIKGAYKIFESIIQKFYREYHLNSEMKWLQNELRLFVWSLVCYLYKQKTQILKMESKEWKIFINFFSYKSITLFQYQGKLIVESSQKPKPWTKSEDQSLLQILTPNFDQGKWNQASKQLFLLSNKKFIRTPKQCRQRWNNHLDPNKIKGAWKVDQCLKMFKYVKENGKKWAKLRKLFEDSRDEHSIKNKFNSLLRKQQKMLPRLTETELYDFIILRLHKAKDNSETEFIESYEQKETVLCVQRPLSFSEKIRMKLMGCNFSSKDSTVYSKTHHQQNIYQQQNQIQISMNTIKMPKCKEEMVPDIDNQFEGTSSMLNIELGFIGQQEGEFKFI